MCVVPPESRGAGLFVPDVGGEGRGVGRCELGFVDRSGCGGTEGAGEAERDIGGGGGGCFPARGEESICAGDVDSCGVASESGVRLEAGAKIWRDICPSAGLGGGLPFSGGDFGMVRDGPASADKPPAKRSRSAFTDGAELSSSIGAGEADREGGLAGTDGAARR